MNLYDGYAYDYNFYCVYEAWELGSVSGARERARQRAGVRHVVVTQDGPDPANSCQCFPPQRWASHDKQLSVLSSSEMGLTLQTTVSAYLLRDGPDPANRRWA